MADTLVTTTRDIAKLRNNRPRHINNNFLKIKSDFTKTGADGPQNFRLLLFYLAGAANDAM
jgi:hypothetical protein